MVEFLPIDCTITNEDEKKLIKGQLYFLVISAAIKFGQYPADLAAGEQHIHDV